MVTQKEVDNVAAFVQAVRELKTEPFFGEDELYGIQVSPKIHIDVGTPANLKSALAPFRRIWMESEPCNFNCVYNILYRNCENDQLQGLMAECRANLEKSKKDWLFPIGPPELTPQKTVEVWLNTRYAHIGQSSRQGKFTSEDFAKFEKTIGSAQFEFFFRLAVRSIGTSYINLLQFAELALEQWAKNNGIKPTHPTTSSFGVVGTEVTGDGTTITRDTPGWSPTQESSEARCDRLLRRKRFHNLETLLNHLQLQTEKVDYTQPVIWRKIVAAETIPQLIEGFGFRCEQQEGFSREGLLNVSSISDTATGSRGFVSRYDDGTVRFGENYVLIMNRILKEFQKVFLDET